MPYCLILTLRSNEKAEWLGVESGLRRQPSNTSYYKTAEKNVDGKTGGTNPVGNKSQKERFRNHDIAQVAEENKP